MRGLLAVAMMVGWVGLASAGPDGSPYNPARDAKFKATMAKLRARQAAGRKDWSASAPVMKDAASKDTGKAKALHVQGLSAYKAGNYNAAVQKFAAAMDASPSPELLYHAAQAYRLKGERAKALELYEQYLDVAPDGGAASVCRWYVERLRATP